MAGDDAEAAVGIHQFHDGHGPQQEEQDAGNLAKKMQQLMMAHPAQQQFFLRFAGHGVGEPGGNGTDIHQGFGVEDVQGPAQHAGEDGGGGFIDLDVVFGGDGQVADHKHDAYGN